MTGRAKEMPPVPIHIKCYIYAVVNGGYVWSSGAGCLVQCPNCAWYNVQIVHLFWSSPCFLVPFKAVPDGLF